MLSHYEKDLAHHEVIASEYDRVVVSPRAVANEQLFRQFIRIVKDKRRMIDIACGTGHMILRCASQFESVVGVDHSAAMLQEARRKVAERGWNNVQLYESDVFDFLRGMRETNFDLVTCVGFLHHVPSADVPDAIDAIARLLAPGGTLLVSEPVKIDGSQIPEAVSDWNRRSVAARTQYSMSADDPDEEPLDADLLLQAHTLAGLALLRVRRTLEVFPHQEPASLRDRAQIWYFNRRWGHLGNVLTIASQSVGQLANAKSAD